MNLNLNLNSDHFESANHSRETFSGILLAVSKNILAYYCKRYNLIGYVRYSLPIRRYRVAASNATKSSVSQKKQCLFLILRNNFEEITFFFKFRARNLIVK